MGIQCVAWVALILSWEEDAPPPSWSACKALRAIVGHLVSKGYFILGRDQIKPVLNEKLRHGNKSTVLLSLSGEARSIWGIELIPDRSFFSLT